MKIKDYHNWICNEIKESPLFTGLNITGIVINVFLVLIFLGFASGIRETAISQITKNIDLYTIEVSKQTKDLLHFNQFKKFATDQRVQQVIPVIYQYLDLRLYTQQPNDKVEEQENVFTLPVYVESHFSEAPNGKDLRTDYLKFTDGRELTKDDTDGIVVSRQLFNKIIASSDEVINTKNYQTHTLSLVLKKGNDKEKKFDCKIVGIAEKTSFDNILVYVSFPLAKEMDNWINDREVSNAIDYRDRNYERIDIVADNLKNLTSLRKDLNTDGYRTRSILDRIDNVNLVINVVRFIFFFIISISILISGFNLLITLTSYVLKRRKVIGTLKALGATDFQIQVIYILHSMYLCIVGIVIGTLFAQLLIIVTNIVLAKIDRFEDISLFRLQVHHIIGVGIVTIIIAIISALVPAKKSVSITPIETMRSS